MENIKILEDGKVLRIHTPNGMVSVQLDNDQTFVEVTANRIGNKLIRYNTGQNYVVAILGE